METAAVRCITLFRYILYRVSRGDLHNAVELDPVVIDLLFRAYSLKDYILFSTTFYLREMVLNGLAFFKRQLLFAQSYVNMKYKDFLKKYLHFDFYCKTKSLRDYTRIYNSERRSYDSKSFMGMNRNWILFPLFLMFNACYSEIVGPIITISKKKTLFHNVALLNRSCR